MKKNEQTTNYANREQKEKKERVKEGPEKRGV